MILNQRNTSQLIRLDNSSYQFKKIKNYLFSYADVIGKGNFSTVYKATNELNRKYST
jgi:hypothetical protein